MEVNPAGWLSSWAHALLGKVVWWLSSSCDGVELTKWWSSSCEGCRAHAVVSSSNYGWQARTMVVNLVQWCERTQWRLSSVKVVNLTRWCWAHGWQGSMRVVKLVPNNDSRAHAKELTQWYSHDGRPAQVMFVLCSMCDLAMAALEVSGGCGTWTILHWELLHVHVCLWPDNGTPFRVPVVT